MCAHHVDELELGCQASVTLVEVPRYARAAPCVAEQGIRARELMRTLYSVKPWTMFAFGIDVRKPASRTETNQAALAARLPC